jgi:hypothetical protein
LSDKQLLNDEAYHSSTLVGEDGMNWGVAFAWADFELLQLELFVFYANVLVFLSGLRATQMIAKSTVPQLHQLLHLLLPKLE